MELDVVGGALWTYDHTHDRDSLPQVRPLDEVDGSQRRPGLVARLTTLAPTQATRTPFRCTACQGDFLHAHLHSDLEVDWCPTCCGVFLGHGELERLLMRTTAATPQRRVPVNRGRRQGAGSPSPSPRVNAAPDSASLGFWASLSIVADVTDAVGMVVDVVTDLFDVFDD